MNPAGCVRWLTLALFAATQPAWPAPAAGPTAEPVLNFEVLRFDTLIGLSREVLVTPGAWREVARLNRLPDPNRILPGQLLRIPTRLLRVTPLSATLAGSSGDVQIGTAAAVEGSPLAAGQTVQTGSTGSAVVEFADGSRLRLPPSTLAHVLTSQSLGARPAGAELPAGSALGGWFSGAMRVLRGSVEVFATKILRAKPFEVMTPTAVVGVRGTGFRVSYEEGDGVRGTTRVEVVDGQVRFDAGGRERGVDVPAGFGSTADAAGGALRVVKLLDAPDLSSVPARFERPIVRFSMPAETVPLRMQVAGDAAFDRIVVDQRVEPGGEVRIAGLMDATWHLRSRRIDTDGLEGLDAKGRFVLKARPEPPAYLTPRSDAKQAVGPIEFAWAPNVDAARARLQVAEDAAFTRVLQDRIELTGATLRADIASPGQYFWRLASVRANGDAGPFGDAQRFELRPLPEPPTGGLSADGRALVFTWGGRGQDRQQVQLASDPAFAQIVEQAELSSPTWTLPASGRSGRFFFRYRSVEPDGFVSPYSSTLMIDVPRDWSGLWLLLPVLLLF